ncbi:MAG: ABC transporter permease [Firmicutes bacterium]|nr:ABC transporter permease [Candidatus Colimorpha enterica]
MSAAIIKMLGMGILETLYMTLFSTLCAYIIGLPLGVILYVTSPGALYENKPVNSILGVIVNLLRSVPFIVLLITILPFTRLIVGTTIGSTATVVPLVVAAAPFVARMVESSLKEIDGGIIEAALSMGTSPMQIIVKVLIPEAMPSMIVGSTIAVTTILGYSAMAGFTAGGGLGDIAIRYGYYRYDTKMMLITVVLLVIIVQVLQEVGMKIAKKADKRIRK